METIWPNNRTPTKAQVERMYKLAYTIDAGFFRPADVVDFGLDLHRLKEFGQVRMSKSPAQMRRHVPGLWDRMDPHQRGAFILTYLLEALGTVGILVDDLEREMGEHREVREAMTWLQAGVFGRFPKALQKRLERGLQRWSNGRG